MCVNEEDALEILMVVELPIVAAFMLTDDFRGMVYNATVKSKRISLAVWEMLD